MQEQLPSIYAAPDKFADRLASFSSDFPEIAELQEPLKEAGGELIQEFGIEPKFFDDEHNSLLFMGIAQRYTNLTAATQEGGLTREQHYREKEFIANALLMVAGRNASYYNSLDDHSGAEEGISGSHLLLDAYRECEDPALGRLLQGEIERTDLFGEQRAQLGIPEGRKEEPFELHVLDVDERANPSTEPERYAKTRNLAAKIGLKSLPGTAWVSKVDGVSHMAIPRQLLVNFFSDSEWASTRAKNLLRHEYVHTQGNLASSGIYMNAEEVRANRISGEATTYADEAYLFGEIKELTGVDVIESIIGKQKQGEQPTVHRDIVHNLGLSALLGITLASPASRERDHTIAGDTAHYLPDVPELLEQVLSHTGISPEVIRERRRAYDDARPRTFRN
jgi:hypothetical protein